MGRNAPTQLQEGGAEVKPHRSGDQRLCGPGSLSSLGRGCACTAVGTRRTSLRCPGQDPHSAWSSSGEPAAARLGTPFWWPGKLVLLPVPHQLGAMPRGGCPINLGGLQGLQGTLPSVAHATGVPTLGWAPRDAGDVQAMQRDGWCEPGRPTLLLGRSAKPSSHHLGGTTSVRSPQSLATP